MSKENDKSKTSKTARVMNLLSKKQEQPAPAPEEAPAAPAAASETPAPAAPAESTTAPLSPILSLAPDAAVSVQIKNALEDALESELSEETAPEAAAVSDTPVQQTAPEAAVPQDPVVEAASLDSLELSEESPVLIPEPDLTAASAPSDVPAPGTPEPAEPVVVSAPTPTLVQTAQLQVEAADPGYPGYINVMQVLVEEKAPKYMKMFGICTCPKCQEDVKALALNHLPPKYVVMGEGERIPKLTFYEGHYSSDITAQLLKACTVVMQTPHHDR